MGVRGAVLFLGAQLSASLAILLTLNRTSIVLGASSLALVAVYPFMKRITDWPQLVLGNGHSAPMPSRPRARRHAMLTARCAAGLAFNWGALLGWSAVGAQGSWVPALLLYQAGIFWTLCYDTLYAHQDKLDDAVVGIRSTARLFGDDAANRAWLYRFTAGFAVCLGAAGLAMGAHAAHYIGTAAASAYLWRLVRDCRFDSPADCASRFMRAHRIGAIVFASIVIDKLLRGS